ncbi:unnamed protein product, partial [Larinioides sclopetarius]
MGRKKKNGESCVTKVIREGCTKPFITRVRKVNL